MKSGQNNISVKGAVVTLSAVALIIAASVVYVMMQPPKKVSNFEECIDAGGPLMESYPEQCSYDGQTYVNETQRPPKESGYIGMMEDEALLTASDNKIPARVVERDDESLPVTMDFIYRRHNFYVRDGFVYKVDIEGEGEDIPGGGPEVSE